MKPDQPLDPFAIFEARRPFNNNEEIWHKEQERKSYDIIRVKNPTNTDYFIEWDKRYTKVPANGTADVMRYLAKKYCHDMSVDTINKTNETLHTRDLEERAKKGLPNFDNKYDEQKATYESARYPKTNDPKVLSEIYSELWLGTVYEFGKDAPTTASNDPRAGEVDMTPLEVKLLKQVENRRIELNEPPPMQNEKPVFVEAPNIVKNEPFNRLKKH